MEECNDEPWFVATVLDLPDNPLGFMTWTEGITQKKYKITLPDNSIIGAKMFIDHQGVFDNGAYTQFLIHRYNEINNN